MALTDKVRIVTIPDSAGTSLTRATITGLTPARLEAYANTEHALARVMAEAVEARAVGVVPSALDDLMLSSIREVDKKTIARKNVPGQSIILPYSYRTRQANLASEYFNIASGEAHPTAGAGGIPASAWNIVVNTGPSAYKSDLTELHRYFLPGEYIYVENIDSAGVAGARTAYMTAYKVIAAVTAIGVTTITIAPNLTAAGWAALSAPQKAVYQPTFGVVQIGTNNVRDEEAYAHNQVAEKSMSLIADWHQCSRYTQSYNDEYAMVLKKIMGGEVNEYLKKFQWMDLAQQNKKQRAQFDKKWLRSVFYGQQISEKQTVETTDELDQVVDPDDGTVYGYKANALGLRTLLAAENKIIDAAGGPLDLDLLFQIAYDVKRNREVGGSAVDCIDFMTDKDTANLIDIVLLNYLRKTFGYAVQQHYQAGQVLDGSGLVAYKYKKYSIPSIGIDIAVFVDQFFTDRVTQFGNGTGGAQGSVDFRSRGRAIWAIDWSDFNIGIVATNSAKREYRGQTYSNANALFATVITPNTKHYDLRSTTWTTQLGDASRHAVIENFSLDVAPSVTLSIGA
jgi:hypothetical protein